MLVFIHVLSVCVYIHLLYTCIIIVVYQWVRERATVTRPLLSVATAWQWHTTAVEVTH